MQQEGALKPDRPPMPTRGRRSLVPVLFLLVVVIPTLLTLAYALTSRAPLFSSQVQIAVEDRSQADLAGASSIMASIGITSGEPNSLYSLRHFIQSHDALNQLEESYGFRSHYGPDHGDWLTALPEDASQDETLRYYRRVVTPYISTTEGILTLDVWAHDPKVAQDTAQALLDISEAFLNRMNARALEDQVAFYRDEVSAANKALAEKRAELTNWRNSNNALDPLAQAQMIQGIISELETELSQVRADIKQLLNTDDPERFTPKVKALQEREASLILQITETRGRLTGDSSGTVAVQISAYEELNANVELAVRNLDLALSSLKAAQQAALQQQKYLLVISSPSLNDARVFPLAGFHSLAVLAAALLVFGVLVLVHSIIRDYRNA